MRSNLAKFNPGYFCCAGKMVKLICHQIFLRIKAKFVNEQPLEVPQLLLTYPRVTANFTDLDFNLQRLGSLFYKLGKGSFKRSSYDLILDQY